MNNPEPKEDASPDDDPGEAEHQAYIAQAAELRKQGREAEGCKLSSPDKECTRTD